MKLSLFQQRCIYGISLILLVSGVGWLIPHYLFRGTDDFGDAHRISELWWMRLHGGAAMLFLIAVGALLPLHITTGLKLRKNRASGLFLLSLIAILILTGYGLYYFGDEQSRAWISAIHWIIGLIAALGLGLHVWLGTRNRT